jgi:hypothetical protein
MRTLRKALVAVAMLFVCGAATAVTAQTAPARQPRVAGPRGPLRLELGAGIGIDTPVGLGERQATLRGTGGSPFPLFTTSSEIATAVRIEGRAAYALTPRYVVEGQFAFVRPELRSTVSGDAEGGADASPAGRIDQYSVSVGMAVRLPVRFAGMTPFFAGGAGYVRELRENLPPVESGYLVYAGGGMRRALMTHPDRFLRAVGVRGDVRVQWIDGVVNVVDRPRTQVTISGGLFVAF